MSEQTAIEWADKTFNPWIGCTKVSPGCANCYAESEDKRRGWTPAGWGKGKPRKRTTETYWKQALKWNLNAEFCRLIDGDLWRFVGGNGSRVIIEALEDNGNCVRVGIRRERTEEQWAAEQPYRPRVFPSLCDWLDDEVPIEWLADFLNLIRITPNLDWLLLTKRPELFIQRINAVITHVGDTISPHDSELTLFCSEWLAKIYPRNVWLGVSVEDQERAEQRIPKLLETPAAVRFLSCEPLLGPLDLRKVNVTPFIAINALSPGAIGPRTKIDWVIVGGESGQKARPCNIDWIRKVLGDCQAIDTPCFVKQLGGNVVFYDPGVPGGVCGAGRLKDRKGGDPAEWPEDLRVRQMPELLST